MNIATAIARVLLGLLFVVVGLDEFLQFMPLPQVHGVAEQFLSAMTEKTHYMYVVAACEVVGGSLLLMGLHVPLGLTLLGPVIVNILCFHVFMDRTGLPIALIISALALLLLWRHRGSFAGLIKP